MNCILPEQRQGDQDWSHFEVDLLDLAAAADLAVRAVVAF